MDKNKLEYYVLIYDKNTMEYQNEIIFTTYDKALKEYNETNVEDKNHIVELIYSPIDKNLMNEIIKKKYLKGEKKVK